jgi:tRNA wybutosine-synthesizing protein 2
MSGNKSSGQVTPFEKIVKASKIPEELKAFLPKKWELLGDVLLMKIPDELADLKREIAQEYAAELQAKTVCLDLGIEGELREPKVELLFGEKTETIHKENGVKFKLDVAKLMFSSGNTQESVFFHYQWRSTQNRKRFMPARKILWHIIILKRM